MKSKKLLVLGTVLKEYGFKKVLGIKPNRDYDYNLVFRIYWFNILVYSKNILSRGIFTKIFVKHFTVNVSDKYLNGCINLLNIYAEKDKVNNSFLNNLLVENLIGVTDTDAKTKYLNHIFQDYLHIASGNIISIAKIKVYLDIASGNIYLEFPNYTDGKIQKLLNKNVCIGSIFNDWELKNIYRDILFYKILDFNKRYVKYTKSRFED